MTQFKEGDKVKFTDKYGIEQIGTYLEESTIPTCDGELSGHSVVAHPFKDIDYDEPVKCFVMTGNLTKVETQ